MRKTSDRHKERDPLLTTKEAARRLGVSLRSLQLWAEDGRLFVGRTPGGHRRVRASEVDRLAKELGILPAKPAAKLTDERIGAIYAEWSDKGPLALMRAVEAEVLAANGFTAETGGRHG